jgi:hypothetical protein
MTPTDEAAILSQMAEDARLVADRMRQPGQKLYMLQIAARYEVLAKHAAADRTDETPTT